MNREIYRQSNFLIISTLFVILLTALQFIVRLYFNTLSDNLIKNVLILSWLVVVVLIPTVIYYQIFFKVLNLSFNHSLVVNVAALAFVWLYFEVTSNVDIFIRHLTIALVTGLAFSMLLFLMVAGFYLIFGLADVINFAHGAFFMLGGFIGFESYILFEDQFIQMNLFNTNKSLYSLLSFLLAIILTGIIMGVIGGIIEVSTIRPLYKKPLNQILLTVGISFVIIEIATAIWKSQKTYQLPVDSPNKYFFITGNINLGNNIIFDTFSFVIIIFGLLLALAMWLVFTRTKIGFQIQAAIEDSEMVEALGTNVKLMLSLVFIIGTALAGIAGFFLVPWSHGGATVTNATTYLLYAFVIVVVGGAHYGKFEGTFFGSLIIGFAYKFTEQFFYDYTAIIVFVIMALVLIFKPTGLTGQQ